MDQNPVRIVDLTTEGVGLRAPRSLAEGAVVDLVVELPTSDGGLRATSLRLTVTSCVPQGDAPECWRVGGSVAPRHDGDRAALTEYCHAAVTRSRRPHIGRVVADPGTPPRTIKASDATDLLEALTGND